MLTSEIVLDSIDPWWGHGTTKVRSSVFWDQAESEAERQIEAGDLNISLDQDEEADRIRRARSVPFPGTFHGNWGGLVINETSRATIAPMPRFEYLVCLLKRTIFDRNTTTNPANHE